MTHAILTLLLIALAIPASAQPNRSGQRGAPQARSAPAGERMTPGQVHELFDAMLAMQAQRALSLSGQEHAQFLSRLTALQEARRRNQRERVRLLSELQRLSNPRSSTEPSEGDLKQRLDALQDLDARAAADLRHGYAAIDEVLTPLQQARFRVLEEQIERRKLELVGRARNPRR